MVAAATFVVMPLAVATAAALLPGAAPGAASTLACVCPRGACLRRGVAPRRACEGLRDAGLATDAPAMGFPASPSVVSGAPDAPTREPSPGSKLAPTRLR